MNERGRVWIEKGSRGREREKCKAECEKKEREEERRRESAGEEGGNNQLFSEPQLSRN